MSARAKDIVKLAYPTVNYEYIQSCSWTSGSLTCVFRYQDTVGGTDEDTRALRFDLDTAGRIASISDAGGGSVWPPFFTSQLVLELFIEGTRQDIAQHPEKYSEADLAMFRLLQQNHRADEYLRWSLNLQLL